MDWNGRMARKVLITGLLVVSMLAICGCGGRDVVEHQKNDGDGGNNMLFNDVPVSGGVTNNTDYNAPKEIKSENLISLSVGFYHEDKYNRSSGRYYNFILEPDEEGRIIFKESYVSEGFEVDKSVLSDVQAIIKKYDLAKSNGYHKTTAGLPPQFEECFFEAKYDSGEYISFSENSDPSAAWSQELLEYFAYLMADHGDDKYIIPKITGVIERFKFDYQENGLLYSYDTITVPKKGVHKSLEEIATNGYDESESDEKLYRSVYDLVKDEEVDRAYAEKTDVYYDGLLDILSDEEIRDYENFNTYSDLTADGEPETCYEFYIEFEGGDIMSGASADPADIEKFKPVAERIMRYIDEYLDSHKE